MMWITDSRPMNGQKTNVEISGGGGGLRFKTIYKLDLRSIYCIAKLNIDYL